MKKLFIILVVVVLTASVFAQSPQKMSYQAVIRDISNNLVTNTTIGMQISILQGSPTGTPVYVETQTPTTNINGLATVEIGNGTIVSGSFTSINWAAGPYFIKTETDPLGGTAYNIMGTQQLMSVPYALYAGTSYSGNKIAINTTQANVNYSNGGVETTLYTVVIPANTLDTNNGIRFRVLISDLYLGNSPDGTITLRAKFGGTTFSTVTLGIGSTASTQGWSGAFIEGILVADNSTSNQKGSMSFSVGNSNGDGAGELVRIDNKYGTSSTNSTLNQNLVITAQTNGAQQTEIYAEGIIVELIR